MDINDFEGGTVFEKHTTPKEYTNEEKLAILKRLYGLMTDPKLNKQLEKEFADCISDNFWDLLWVAAHVKYGRCYIDVTFYKP